MSLEAARGFLAAGDARRSQRQVEAERATSTAQEVDDDGGLIAYAERLARRRYPAKASSMRHLAPIAEKCEAAERALRGQCPPVFTVMHAAVQHGKSSLLQAFVLRTLRRNPRVRIGFVSFVKDRAVEKMWEARELAIGEGIHLHPSFNTKQEWRTVEGGFVRAGGILDSAWTGGDFDLIIPDDLYGGPKEAESAAHRHHVERAFEQVLETRGQGRTSILVSMARWHPNDISGALIRKGWPYVCLSAIDESGCDACTATRRDNVRRAVEVHTCRALWPDVYPLAHLLAKRDGRPARDGHPAILPVAKRAWNAMWQGRPIADGARAFDPAHLVLYDRLPDGAYVETIGLDAAYGARARHDRSALVPWRQYLDDPGALWLADPWIGHEVIELFACRTAAMQIARAGGPRLPLPGEADDMHLDVWRARLRQPDVAHARRVLTMWYASGTEKGGEAVMRTHGAQVHVVPAGIDKLARAQGGYVDPELGGYTSTWSEGRIRWPRHESEAATIIRVQHEDFTGSPGDDDDGVDAAVAGHDAMQLHALVAQVQRQRQRTLEQAKRQHRPMRAPDGGDPRLRW